MEERRGARGGAWQVVAGVLVLLVGASVVASLVWFRSAAPRGRPAGRALGSVTITSAVDFSCRLPVTAFARQAAMISFPDGAVTDDPTIPASPAGGKGFANASYDAPLARWVPVQRSWVSPDGRKYAFATTTSGVPGEAPTGDVRIHDIASGRDATVWRGSGSAMVLGWSGTTLVFGLQSFIAPGPAPEYWTADEAGGQARRAGPNPPLAAPAPGQPALFIAGGMVGGGAAWGLGQSQAPSPSAPVPGKIPGKGPDTLVRLDLRDGTLSHWYTAAGSAVGLVAIDAQGHPIVSVTQVQVFATPPPPGYRPPQPKLLVVTGRDQATSIGGDQPAVLTSGSADAHGVWFAAPGELWLYRGGSLTRVAQVPPALFPTPPPPPGVMGKPGVATAGSTGMPLSGPFLQIAGACT